MRGRLIPAGWGQLRQSLFEKLMLDALSPKLRRIHIREIFLQQPLDLLTQSLGHARSGLVVLSDCNHGGHLGLPSYLLNRLLRAIIAEQQLHRTLYDKGVMPVRYINTSNFHTYNWRIHAVSALSTRPRQRTAAAASL